MRAFASISLVAILLLGGEAATRSHVVRRGETLGRLASRYGVSVGALARANQLGNPDHIVAGSRLLIPSGGGGEIALHHVVRPGETLSRIAARYKVDVGALAALNGIVNRNRLFAGVRLRLAPPAGTAPAPPPGPAVNLAQSTGVHVVRSGETLGTIAARYGTTARALAGANGIRNVNLIRIGVRLEVPGGWRCPVVGPVEFFNDWGFPRSGGRFHEGNDLFAPRGTPVVAPVAGTVEQVRGSIAGLQVRLLGDDNVTYLATHLDRFGEGGRVGAGAVVGFVGTSGNAEGTRPHVHFEIHPANGPAVNPYPTLRTACAA